MKLGIIVGATRQGRMSSRQAQWVANEAAKVDDVTVGLVDLRDYPMPFFDEPMSPRYNQNRQIDPAAVPWLKKLEEFDAYVFVTPEYNHSVPGVLKNALDYVTWEINRKPAAVVSHGAAGGARAATDLKEILSESKAVPMPSSSPMTIAGMSDQIDENGELTEKGKANERLIPALHDVLNELKWYSDALATARAQDV